MISEQRIKTIEEATTGTELFESIASAFESFGFDSIGSASGVTPLEVTQAEYDEIQNPEQTGYIYLVTDS